MHEQSLAGQASTAAEQATASSAERSTPLKDFLWTLPQPLLVFGSMFAVATAVTTQWMNADLLTTIMIVLPLPLILVAERIWTKRKDWIPEPVELAEDAAWLAAGAFIWVPLYSDYYQTPISDGFEWVRDSSGLAFSMAPETTLGLVGAALLAITLSEFIYYWLHRVQHESLFWWRIHGTHHHITKMSAARGDRTHPLEWLALMVSRPIILALLGASDDVIAVIVAFGFWQGILNHSNLPLRSGVFGWFLSTAPMHHLHHSNHPVNSNTNYGCSIIIWDRLFGTYSGCTEIESVGAGTGKPLSIRTQLAMAFYPDEKLKSL
ncbi:MAG: sterol desaturase family protein [Pseudomonadales bacterium]|jgi:sterol desaturase/sphingolipid hydroxylase (fatty acid hydroxylase superfamily)|nr:sterol desaturase family protein [Pseudomonadales bacterium]